MPVGVEKSAASGLTRRCPHLTWPTMPPALARLGAARTQIPLRDQGALDGWLSAERSKRRRGQRQRPTSGRCWLGSGCVVTYYTVAPHQERHEQVLSLMAGGVTVTPAYLLARLVLDVTVHGRGLDA